MEKSPLLKVISFHVFSRLFFFFSFPLTFIYDSNTNFLSFSKKEKKCFNFVNLTMWEL